MEVRLNQSTNQKTGSKHEIIDLSVDRVNEPAASAPAPA
jgi:hypothetical protein